LSSFEQFEDRIKKFISLCLDSKKDEHLLVITKEGQLLRDNADLFLSKKAIHSFGNYATAQLRRLKNALARDS